MSSTSKNQQFMKGCVNVQYSREDGFTESMNFIEDISVPEILAKDGQKLRVKVVCVASNPVDYKIAMGNLSMVLKRPQPVVTGCDFSGVVDYIPPHVKTEFKVGDKVCGMMKPTSHPTGGSFAEYCTPLEAECIPMPPTMGFEEAAAFPLVSATSHQALTKQGGIGGKGGVTGQKVVILGGSTATGMAAIQLCKHFACAEIAVTSSSTELCKSLGATTVVNYKEGKVWEKELANGGFDLVYDCLGNDEGSFEKSKLVLKKSKGTKFVTIVGPNPSGKLSVMSILGVAQKIAWRTTTSFFKADPSYSVFLALDSTRGDSGSMTFLSKLIKDENFKIPVDPSSPYEFSADGVRKMFTKQQSGTSKGKLVMRITADPQQ